MTDQEQEQGEETYDPESTAGIPEHGRERLERMREKSFFTSDLSVNEFLLVKAGGLRAARARDGLVIYHIGFQQIAVERRARSSTVLTQAIYQARELAMARMEEEADGSAPTASSACGSTSAARVGRATRRVHRHRHRRPPRARACSTAPRTAGRSRATSPARTSGRCSPRAIARSGS